MAILEERFEPAKVEPNSGFAKFPVSGPEGFLVAIESDKWKLVDTSKSKGKALVMTIAGKEESVAGCTINYNMNLVSDNEQTMAIAKGNLSAIFHAVGITSGVHSDTAILYGRPFRITTVETEDVNGKKFINVASILTADGKRPVEGVTGANQPPRPGAGRPAATPNPAPATNAAPANRPASRPATRPGTRPAPAPAHPDHGSGSR